MGVDDGDGRRKVGTEQVMVCHDDIDAEIDGILQRLDIARACVCRDDKANAARVHCRPRTSADSHKETLSGFDMCMVSPVDPRQSPARGTVTAGYIRQNVGHLHQCQEKVTAHLLGRVRKPRDATRNIRLAIRF